MAIKAKAELRSDVVAMLPNNTTGLINPTLDRALRLDAIDSLIAPSGIVSGAGINVSNNGDGTVTVTAGGAAAATGIPSFVVESAAQPSDAVLTGVVPGLSASPPFPSLVYLLTPNDIDRAADDLEMQINGDTSRVREVVDFRGDALAARDLDPGALYEILAHASPTQQYRLTEPIPVRRQDFNLVISWLPDTPINNQSAFEAAVDSADAAASMTAFVTMPVITGNRDANEFAALGVPMDAPDLDEDETYSYPVGQGETPVITLARVTAWDGWRYMGTEYKWWSLGSLRTAGVENTRYQVGYLPY